MTLSDIIDNVINRYQTVYEGIKVQIETLDVYRQNTTESVRELRDLVSKVKLVKEVVEGFQIDNDIKTITDMIAIEIQAPLQEEKAALLAEADKHVEFLQNAADSVVSQAKEYNNQVRALYKDANQEINNVIALQNRLRQHTNQSQELCEEFCVDYSNMKPDVSKLSLQQIKQNFIEFCIEAEKERVHSDIIDKYVGNSVVMKLIFLALFIVIMLTPVSGILAIAYYMYIIKKTASLKADLEKATIILAYAYNVTIDSMAATVIPEDELAPETIDIDTDPLLEHLRKPIYEIQEKITNLINTNQETKDRQKEWDTYKDRWLSSISSFMSRCETLKAEGIKKCDETLAFFDEAIKDAISKQKLLCNRVSTSFVFDSKIYYGYNSEIGEELYDDYKGKSILIQGKVTDQVVKDLLKLLAINYISNVMINCMKIHYLDDIENAYYIKDIPGPVPDLNELFIWYGSTNIRDFFTNLESQLIKNINEVADFPNFNAMAKDREDNEKLPPVYNAFFAATNYAQLTADLRTVKLLDNCSRYGIYIVCVVDPDDEKAFPEGWRPNPETTILINPNSYMSKGVYTITKENIFNLRNCLTDALSKSKAPLLAWKDFVSKFCPDDKIWSYSAVEQIFLVPGAGGGDINSPTMIPLGNTPPVHGLVSGKTGAGKSGFLNQLIASYSRMYAPWESDLILVDMKGVEFSYYLRRPEYNFTLPHIRACICTSDPDFVQSLCKEVQKSIEDKYKTIQDAGHKNLVQYNKAMRNEGTPEKCLPRTLMLVDEAKVIIDKAESEGKKAWYDFVTYCGNVARAAGFHLVLCSQETEPLAPKEILGMFEARFALRSTTTASQFMLGSQLAANIPYKLGWCYPVSAPTKEEYLLINKVPFVEDDASKAPPGELIDLKKHIKDMNDKAIEMGMPPKDIITYDERQVHPIEELMDIHDKYVTSRITDEQVIMVLGERMEYSSNRMPYNIAWGPTPNTHLLISCEDQQDLVSLYRTIIVDVEKSKTGKHFTNCQLDDIYELAEIDTLYKNTDELVYTTRKTDFKDFVKFIFGVYNGRKELRKKHNDPMVFIMIGWDRTVGFGISPDSSITNPLGNMMAVCTEFNIHLIFICVNASKIRPSIMESCGIRICTKTSRDVSQEVIKSGIAGKPLDGLDNGYAHVLNGQELTKFKIYKYAIKRTLAENSLFLDKREVD